jgi:hypothetical protein
MNELTTFLFGLFILILGIPIGKVLANVTKEELKDGKKWFRLLVAFGLLGGIIGFILENDGLMFSCFFIALVTSQSLDFKSNKKSKKKIKKKK